MHARILALSLGIACTAASADQTPQPQPAARGGTVAAAKAQGSPVAALLASPVIMQTTAVRLADGSIALVCDEKRNPHPQRIVPYSPAPVPQQ